MQREIEKIIRDIILNEITVDAANVWIQDQNKVIPPDDDKLFVVVGMVDARPISNINRTEPTPTGMNEIQITTQLENIQIDLFSRDNKARVARAEVQMAMQSIFAQQKMEEYDFKIFRIPASFINSSEAEGTSQLNRFSIVIPCHVWYRKEKAVSSTNYYDDFDTRVDDENTIGQPNGLIEFNIKDE